MTRSLNVHFLPSLFEPDEVRGGTVVICDILRASTTMTFALASGAERVLPCATVDEAWQLKLGMPAGLCLLGGERGGVKIEGFNLSNSPQDYSADVVKGKTVVFTTTNGTMALLRSNQASEILVGSFVNQSAVVDHLLKQDRPIHIVCAGTNGKISSEDVLFAGVLADLLRSRMPELKVTDSTELAGHHWQMSRGDLTLSAIDHALRKSHGGQNLIALGYEADIALAAAIDSVPILGILTADGLRKLPDGPAT